MSQAADESDCSLAKRPRLTSPALTPSESSGFTFNNDWSRSIEQFENELPDELLQPSSSTSCTPSFLSNSSSVSGGSSCAPLTLNSMAMQNGQSSSSYVSTSSAPSDSSFASTSGSFNGTGARGLDHVNPNSPYQGGSHQQQHQQSSSAYGSCNSSQITHSVPQHAVQQPPIPPGRSSFSSGGTTGSSVLEDLLLSKNPPPNVSAMPQASQMQPSMRLNSGPMQHRQMLQQTHHGQLVGSPPMPRSNSMDPMPSPYPPNSSMVGSPYGYGNNPAMTSASGMGGPVRLQGLSSNQIIRGSGGAAMMNGPMRVAGNPQQLQMQRHPNVGMGAMPSQHSANMNGIQSQGSGVGQQSVVMNSMNVPGGLQMRGPSLVNQSAQHYVMDPQPSGPSGSQQRFMSVNGMHADSYIVAPPGYGTHQPAQTIMRHPSQPQHMGGFTNAGMNVSGPPNSNALDANVNYVSNQGQCMPVHMTHNPGMNTMCANGNTGMHAFSLQNGPNVGQNNAQQMMGNSINGVQPNQMVSVSNPAMNQVVGVGAGTSQGAQDPEKRKLIQQQLVLLLHAHKCQQRDREAPNGQRPCNLPHCSTMKSVLSHMTSCKEGRDCQYPHCASSRQIIAHWKNCKRQDCPVCLPLKQVTQNAGSTDSVVSQFYNNVSGGNGSFISPTELSASDLASGGVGPAAPNNASLICQTNALGPSRNIMLPNASQIPRNVSVGGPPGSSQSVDFTGAIGGGPARSMSPSMQNVNTMNMNGGSYPSPRGSSVNPSGCASVGMPPNLQQQAPPQQQQMPNSSMSHSSYHNINSPGQQLLFNSLTQMPQQPLPHGLPPPEGASVQKEWHKQVTQDLRNHLVSKLVKAIFPSPDPAAIHDQRIKDLIAYARKVEKEMFEQANDREEYYHLLAEKIYKIQKELQEKKQKRLQQQQEETMRKEGAPFPLPDMHTVEGPPNKTVPMDPYNGPLSSAGRSGATNFTLPQSQSGLYSGTFGPGSCQAIAKLEDSFKNDRMDDSISSVELKFSSLSGENGSFLCDAAVSSVDSKVGLKEVKLEPVSGSEPASSSAGAPSDQALANTSAAEVKTEPGTQQPASNSAAADTSAKHQKVPRKTFHPDELRVALLPILEKLHRMEEAVPFRVPVDPELLQIPDYFDIIKTPMDLSTIRAKLDNGEYKDPWEFCDDIWLMCENAWLYNRKNSKVYKLCTRLSEVFCEEVDPVMAKLGYCCGHKLHFTPLALFCYGQPMCTIPRDAQYYSYQSNTSQYGVTVAERYTYCKKCFEDIPGETINLSDDPNSANNYIPKNQFQLLKNDQIEYEPFVDCVDCGRKWHQICALHSEQIWPGGFVCDNCQKAKNKKRAENKYTAKRLPSCRLATFIETRVNTFLKKKQKECDKEIGEVIVRVLSSSDKEVEVKPGMRSRFVEPGEMPEKFPYRAKALFAFQNIDGAEVCFFGLHVQEYGSDAPPPNSRRVYVAYLDSVYFFQPKQYRTAVYHEILLGYLEYVKNLGYTMGHIWACPPSEGDDYIFHCHPPEQKIPKPKRLQEWYKKMLDKGIIERTVQDYKDIYKQACDENLTSAAQLYYFEGDFWPNVMEEAIRDLDAEEQKKRKDEESSNASDLVDDDDDVDDGTPGYKGGKKNKQKGMTKKNKSNKNKIASGVKKNKKGIGSGNELTDKLYSTMDKHKEVFFAIRLHSPQTAATLGPITDPDTFFQCELMDGRDNFLAMARDRHWEFSSLRRSKFSTLGMCYELHTQGQDKFVYTCNNCKQNNARWHCTVCEDYDLCPACQTKLKHEHKMEPLNSLISEESGPKAPDQNSRNESIQRCIQSLVHACSCRDANCRRMSCHKMKRVVQHTKMCKRRQAGNCPVCKQLIALCCYHAKSCTEQQCMVPFCQNIRQKLAEQQQQVRLKKEREMRRRMMVMHGMPALNAPPPSTSAVASSPGPAHGLLSAPFHPSAGAAPGGGMFQGGSSSDMMHNQQHPQQQQTQMSSLASQPNVNVVGMMNMPQHPHGGAHANISGGQSGGQQVPHGAVEVARQIERIAAMRTMGSGANAQQGSGPLSPNYIRQQPQQQQGAPAAMPNQMQTANNNPRLAMQMQQQAWDGLPSSGQSSANFSVPMSSGAPQFSGPPGQQQQMMRMPQNAQQQQQQHRMMLNGVVQSQQQQMMQQQQGGGPMHVGPLGSAMINAGQAPYPNASANQNSQRLMQNFIIKLKTAKTQEEQRQVINELRQNPSLFQQFLRMREASQQGQQAQSAASHASAAMNGPSSVAGQAPPSSQQQQVWNSGGQPVRQMMPMQSGNQQQQMFAFQQQQHAGNATGGSGPSPQGMHQHQMRPMNAQTFASHPQQQMSAPSGYGNAPSQQGGGYGQQSYQGQMMGVSGQMLPPASPLNVGLRQPVSPHMNSIQHPGTPQNMLSQVRSPPSGAIVRSPGPMASASPRSAPSPHPLASQHLQQQNMMGGSSQVGSMLPQVLMDSRPGSQGPPPDPIDQSKYL